MTTRSLDNEVTLDLPAHGTLEPLTYEHWARENLEGPGAFPEACFIALDGDEVVGYTALRRLRRRFAGSGEPPDGGPPRVGAAVGSRLP